MNTRNRVILATVVAFFIATGLITWFLLDNPRGDVAQEGEAQGGGTREGTAQGVCRGPVYGMNYQYDTSGACLPTGCKSGYQEVGGQCIFDGSDTSNLVLPSYSDTSYARPVRVGWRLGKIRF